MKKLLLALSAFCLLLNVNAQVTVNITPDRDNSIYSESNNSGGNGPLFFLVKLVLEIHAGHCFILILPQTFLQAQPLQR
jgi:hypothetical protein